MVVETPGACFGQLHNTTVQVLHTAWRMGTIDRDNLLLDDEVAVLQVCINKNGLYSQNVLHNVCKMVGFASPCLHAAAACMCKDMTCF